MVLITQMVGILTTAFGAIFLVNPAPIRRWMNFGQTDAPLYWAIGVRLALGAVFVAAAPRCQVPGVIQVFGWVMITAGILGIVLGRARLRAMIQWYRERSDIELRGWAVLTLLLGALILYSA
jgi:hypothetical protein